MVGALTSMPQELRPAAANPIGVPGPQHDKQQRKQHGADSSGENSIADTKTVGSTVGGVPDRTTNHQKKKEK